MKLSTKLQYIALLPVVVLLGLAALLTRGNNQQLIELQAKRMAEVVVYQVNSERKHYTQNVIEKLKGAEWANQPDEVRGEINHVPLPAAFVGLVAEDVNASQNEFNYKLVSPWNINPENSLGDSFLNRGFADLKRQEEVARKAGLLNEQLPFTGWKNYVETEQRPDGTFLRLLAPDIAVSASCVTCHNHLEQESGIQLYRQGHDHEVGHAFELNDLLGAIAVEVSIDEVGALASANTSSMVLWIFGACVLVVAFALVFIKRNLFKPIHQLGVRMNNLATDSDELIQSFDGDEINWVAESFTTMIEQVNKHTKALEAEVAERGRAEEAMRKSEAETSAILDATAEAIVTINPRGVMMTANRAANLLFGYGDGEMIGQNISILMPAPIAAEHDGYLQKYMKAIKNNVSRLSTIVGNTREVEAKRKNGELFPMSMRVTIMRHRGEIHFIGAMQDITERKMADERLRHEALHDSLTGLPNRSLLEDRIQQCIQRVKRTKGEKFAVLFLDFDGFKFVNDSLGHRIGDELLVGIAQRLTGCLRGGDTLSKTEGQEVVRIGGDEFVILLDHVASVRDTERVADRIQQQFDEPFMLGGHEVYTSASIGIACGDGDTPSPEELLRDADLAMYRAKADGKARHVIFDQSMHVVATERLNIESDLRRALQSDQFELLYQPIVSLLDGSVGGFEALIRWNHPEMGLVSPDRFIPIAEDANLVIPLGQWVLDEACRQLSEWNLKFGEERGLTMNVNVSQKQISDPTFVDRLKAVIDETGVAPSSLRLEITETVIMKNKSIVHDVLTDIKAMGIQIHMDDFGTGYSSMSYLHQLPLDVLKIDRSFIENLNSGIQFAAGVQAIVTLAHNLNMKVTAEGIETQEQLAEVLTLDCDYGQGYLFAKPLSASEAAAIIQEPLSFLQSA